MEENTYPTISIGGLIESILRQWQMIFSLALVCAIVAGLFSATLPESYTATALVVSTQVSYPVSFGSAIGTESGTDVRFYQERQARLGSYAKLVRNPAIAQVVWDGMSDQLADEIGGIEVLQALVSGEIFQGTDAILISVTHSDPVVAAEIANRWAAAYVVHVNDIYAESASTETYEMVRLQVAEAEKDYEAAQLALEMHISKNQAASLTRQIDETQNMIVNLSTARDLALAFTVEKQLQNPRYVYEMQVADLQNQILQAYENRQRVTRLLQDAENMRLQVQQGQEGAAASNAMALSLLKAQAYAGSQELSGVVMQTEPLTSTADIMLKDLDGLVSALETRLVVVEDEINDLSSQLLVEPDVEDNLAAQAGAAVQSVLDLGGLAQILQVNIADSAIEQEILALEQNIRDLEAQRTHEESTLEQLTHERDLALNTYDSLATKEAELSIATQTKGTQVAFGAPAAKPNGNGVNLMKNIIFAGVVGLVLGVVLSLVIEFWWSYKEIEPYPIINIRLRRKKEGQSAN